VKNIATASAIDEECKKRLGKHGAPLQNESRREWFGRNKPCVFQ